MTDASKASLLHDPAAVILRLSISSQIDRHSREDGNDEIMESISSLNGIRAGEGAVASPAQSRQVWWRLGWFMSGP